MQRWLLLLTMLLLPLAPATAGDTFPLELRGELVQGSLVRGQTDPGARVMFEGESIRVSPEGYFLIGFHRDAPRTRSLIIELPDGRRLDRMLDIAPRDYPIQRIDGLPPRTVTPPPEAQEWIQRDIRMVSEARSRDEPRTDFATDFIWPVSGRITGVYGSQRILNGEPRRPHYGLDIAAPTGTPIRAPAPGVITVAQSDMYFSGGTMIVDHGHGLSSTYLHMSRFHVEVGDRVEQGQVIGEVGATGRVTGPHLCWRFNLFGRRLDPAFVVGERPEPGETVGDR